MTDSIAHAMGDKSRPRRDISRDGRDHTAELLSFIGVKPGQVVVDFLPFRGYFTRLFASMVGNDGRVFAAVPTVLTRIDRIDKGRAEIEAFAASLGNLVLIDGTPELAGSPPCPVDLFFISQNYHDLHDAFMGPVDIPAFNRSVFKSLKPGGTYVISDHTANASARSDVTETLHRIRPEVVRDEVEAAGFLYKGKSSVLANHRDPKSGSIFGRAIRYHTDRFILKFQKPIQGSEASGLPASK
jgi:predicted methyltransferase